MASQRAQALAEQFTNVNEALINYVEGCSEEDLNKVTSGEQWGVRVAAHHIAGSHQPVAGLVQLIATGQPLPALSMEMFNHGNAQHAAEYAHCTKAEIVDLLRNGGAAATQIVAGLSDEQLDRTGELALFNTKTSAQQAIENVLIGHAGHHFDSIKAAVGKE